MHRGHQAVSEIGHMTVDVGGDRCRCGLRGCWETIASTRWLRQQAEDLGLRSAVSITPRGIAGLAADGGHGADDLLEVYADHIAVGLANLFHLLSLPLFILHGDVVESGRAFADSLRARVEQRILPGLRTRPRIEFGDPGTDPAVLGAAATAATFTLGVTI